MIGDNVRVWLGSIGGILGQTNGRAFGGMALGEWKQAFVGRVFYFGCSIESTVGEAHSALL